MPSWKELDEPRGMDLSYNTKVLSHVLEVAGGHIYRTIVIVPAGTGSGGHAATITQTFVPDA